jgi:hypothetical protein
MKKIKLFSLLFMSTILFVNCSNDDDAMQEVIVEGPSATANTKSYNLSSVSDPNISGTVTVTEFTDSSIQLDLNLQNTESSGVYPAHVHFNTAAEGGDIAVSLEAIDGNTGNSSTNFTTLDDGTAISYSEFLNFDGYVNVHLSPEDLGTLVAQGDIGQNELTGETKAYELESVAFEDISGNVTFFKRKNGEALAVATLNNTTAGAMYPGHIHMNTAAEGGDIVVTLNPVNGDTGVGKTNIAAFDDGSSFNYEAILNYDGYVNIHLSADELGTLVGQGDIGQNELTGDTKSYELGSVAFEDISGAITFSKRINGEALATVTLDNTAAGAMYPGHIHMNTAAEGGDIVVTLNPVNGDTGVGKTNIAAFDDGAAFSYEDILVYDGYVNIHLSTDQLGVLVAQGNIGSNEGEDENASATSFNVTNTGTTAYIFNGGSFSDANNPELTLKRGETYEFVVNASGHPFYIKTVQGNTNSNAYNNGVSNNGAQQGTVTFTVPADAPDTLFYNCQFHSVMTAKINIID